MTPTPPRQRREPRSVGSDVSVANSLASIRCPSSSHVGKSGTRRDQHPADWHLYRQRHRMENLFAFMKHYRRIVARFDRLARR